MLYIPKRQAFFVLLMPAFSGQSKILVYVKMHMYITGLFDTAMFSAQMFPATCD